LRLLILYSRERTFGVIKVGVLVGSSSVRILGIVGFITKGCQNMKFPLLLGYSNYPYSKSIFEIYFWNEIDYEELEFEKIRHHVPILSRIEK